MQQKLWRWSGADYSGRGNFFQAINIQLTVTADRVQAVFFRNLTDVEVTHYDQPSDTSVLAGLVSKVDDLPMGDIGPTPINFLASDFGHPNPELRITPMCVANLSRDDEFLGSAEVDGPALYAFPVDVNGRALAPFNVYSQSIATKRASRHTRLQSLDAWPILVSVAHNQLPFTNAHIIVRNHVDSLFVSNLSGWVTSSERPANDGIVGTLPTLKLSQNALSIAAGESATVGVAVQDKNGAAYVDGTMRIYLEETGGFLPIRRIDSVNGAASFRVSALGMKSGEKFKVKVGFRNYSGCDEVEVTVL